MGPLEAAWARAEVPRRSAEPEAGAAPRPSVKTAPLPAGSDWGCGAVLGGSTGEPTGALAGEG